MPFSTQEVSQQSGRPVELFVFTLGTDTYRWTTAAAPVTYLSQVYESIPVSREALAFSSDTRAQALKITVPATTALVRRYINSLPGQRASITISRVHSNDGSNEVVQMFKGNAQTVAFSQNGLVAEIAVVPITAELSNAVPRFVFSSVCNHVLYDSACTVAQSLFRYQNQVTGVAGDTITVQGLATKGDGWANGGFIALPTGDFRQILSHVGDNIRVLVPFPDSLLSLSVEVFAGCDHSISTCSSKFNNVPNFGGYVWVPLNNPFATGLNNA